MRKFLVRSFVGVVCVTAVALAWILFANNAPPSNPIKLTHVGVTNVAGKSFVLFEVTNTSSMVISYGMGLFAPPSSPKPLPKIVDEYLWNGERFIRPWHGVSTNTNIRFAIERPVGVGRWQLKLFCLRSFKPPRFKDRVVELLFRCGLGPLTEPLLDKPVVVKSPEFDSQ